MNFHNGLGRRPFAKSSTNFLRRLAVQKERKKEIPYKEGRMEDIGAHVGYTVLRGRVSKVVETGVQMCYYPAEPPC